MWQRETESLKEGVKFRLQERVTGVQLKSWKAVLKLQSPGPALRSPRLGWGSGALWTTLLGVEALTQGS